MNNLCPTYFNSCFRELFTETKPFNIILRGHLYCESAIERLIKCRAESTERLDIERAKFSSKLRIAAAFAAIPLDLFSVLDKLASYRNSFAHNLEYSFEKKDQTDLANILKSELKEDTFKNAFSNYINGDTTFPGQLRRIVLSVWLLLEVDYLLKTDGIQAGVAISSILSDTALDNASEVEQSLQDTKKLLDELFPETIRNIS